VFGTLGSGCLSFCPLGDIERFDFMKTSSIVLTALFIATCLAYWLPISPVPAARIRVENDVADMRAQTEATTSYDPYYIHVNQFAKILIPATAQK
jgi:hypothetical protein